MSNTSPCPRCMAPSPSTSSACTSCGLHFASPSPHLCTFFGRGLRASIVAFVVAVASLAALIIWADAVTRLQSAAGDYAVVTRTALRTLEGVLCAMGGVALLGMPYFWFQRERTRIIPTENGHLPNQYRIWAWLAVCLALLIAAGFLWFTVSTGLTRLS